MVGVNSQIISPSGASSGIGFAISAHTVSYIVPQLIAHGSYAHSWLGVQVLDLSPDAVQALIQAGMQLSVDKGVLVTDVASGSPAAKAGIQGGNRTVSIAGTNVNIGGDVIVAINNQSITGIQDLALYLDEQTQVGTTVNITLMRGSQKVTVAVTMVQRPQTQQQTGF